MTLGLQPRAFVLLALLATLGVAGCGGHYVNRGATLFADGRYVEAAEVFERTQDRLPESNLQDQARYGLYRGATLLVLGDFAHAQSWLTYAFDVERSHPGTLDQDERAFLDRVWIALDGRYRGLQKSQPDTAIAASQPPPISPEATPTPATAPDNTRRSLVP